MAQFASDAFTGTENDVLSTYSANWTRHTSYANNMEISSGRVRCSTSSVPTCYYHSGTPASADYSVSTDLYVFEANGGFVFNGIVGRVSTSANTMYWAHYAGDTTDGWKLLKIVGGTQTQLGSTVTQSLSVSTTYNIRLEMIGSAIKVYIDGSGTPVISATDTSITAAGKAGLRGNPGTSQGDSLGIHFDNFSADDVGVTYTLYSPTMVYSAGSWYPQVGETVA